MAIFYAILGYILGSAGIEVMNHLEGEPARVVEPEYIPVRPEIAPPPVAAPDVPVQPFSFAEWADEFMAQGEGSGSCGGCARSYAAKSERTER